MNDQHLENFRIIQVIIYQVREGIAIGQIFYFDFFRDISVLDNALEKEFHFNIYIFITATNTFFKHLYSLPS